MPKRREPRIGPAIHGTGLPSGFDEKMEAGVPKNSALWVTQALTKLGLPPELQQLMKYLPLAPAEGVAKMGTGHKTAAQLFTSLQKK